MEGREPPSRKGGPPACWGQVWWREGRSQSGLSPLLPVLLQGPPETGLTSGLLLLPERASLRARELPFTACANSCSMALRVWAASRILQGEGWSVLGKEPPSGPSCRREVSLGAAPADEGLRRLGQLLQLDSLLVGQVLHGLLGAEAGPGGGSVALALLLVLPGLEGALEGLRGGAGTEAVTVPLPPGG